jgi:ATP-dependent DNA helicase DinG
VLPEFDTIVFDEAHEIEDVATDYLGLEVSNTVLKYILDGIVSPKGKGFLMRLKEIEASRIEEITEIVGRLRISGERFFNSLSMSIDSGRAKKLTINEQLISLKNDLSDELQELEQSLRQISIDHSDTEECKDVRTMADRCRSFRDTMDIIIEQTLEEHVYWASMEGRKIRAVATPIDLGAMLNAQLFQIIDRVVLTSATLTVEGSFEYIKDRLGIEDAETLYLESPFEYEKQVCLYIPDNIPDPQDDGYIDAISTEINRIIDHTGGRTLLLFTSYSMLDGISQRINREKIRILRQGDGDSYTLIEEFKRTEKALLLGTYTFWQGIDIPGDALQCVVITKLPFSVPTDPVIEARMESMVKRGLDPFYSYQVPNAVIRFRQGFGRLIRTSEDRGLVAILDSRILKRQYGLTFLKSLPRMRIIKDLSEYYSHL